MFHPKGGIIRKAMEDYSRQRHVDAGYEFVYTPHITKGHLYEVSGHLDWYKEGMFPAMHIDAELNEDGTVRKPGQDYYLKPMNCPMHNLIFRSRGRSYRELPLRLFEFGSVYRYEKSGVVHGLTRVRGMTQDDAHIYCTREQMKDELTSTLNFVLDLLKDYGLDDFYLELSTKNEEKFVGDDAAWEEATRTLAEVAEASGLELVPDPGGAAFYGPKISVQAKDAIGRTWQMSTIQLDFNLPERFELEFQAADGTRQRPVMIHRALFGSVERFMGVLTEHYAGAFPAWLAPVQVVGIPVAESFNDYLFDVVDQLRAPGIRAEVDISSDRFPKKIRTASKDKIPFVLIAGGDDAEAGAVSFRFRDGSQDNGVPVAEAVQRIVDAVRNRTSWRRRGSTCRRPRGRPGSGRRRATDDFGWPASRTPSSGCGPRTGWPTSRAGSTSSRTRTTARSASRPRAGRGVADRLPRRARYVVLNLFPYNPGHLLVCPYRHVPDYTDLTVEETAEFAELTQTPCACCARSRTRRLQPGDEPGRVGGAGIAGHLHQHVVPRWGGDANFFPIIAQTKAVTQTLGEVRQQVADAWPQESRCSTDRRGTDAEQARPRAFLPPCSLRWPAGC